MILLHSDTDLAVTPALGLNVQLSLSVQDWLGTVGQIGVAPGGADAPAGGRLGSIAGAVAGVAAPLIALIGMRDS